jgi:hypothetical protein
LLCKEPSKESERLLQEMIERDTQLNEQYQYLLTVKNRLSLITYSLIKHPPTNQNAVKLLMHLCQSLNQLEAK